MCARWSPFLHRLPLAIWPERTRYGITARLVPMKIINSCAGFWIFAIPSIRRKYDQKAPAPQSEKVPGRSERRIPARGRANDFTKARQGNDGFGVRNPEPMRDLRFHRLLVFSLSHHQKTISKKGATNKWQHHRTKKRSW